MDQLRLNTENRNESARLTTAMGRSESEQTSSDQVTTTFLFFACITSKTDRLVCDCKL